MDDRFVQIAVVNKSEGGKRMGDADNNIRARVFLPQTGRKNRLVYGINVTIEKYFKINFGQKRFRNFVNSKLTLFFSPLTLLAFTAYA